MLCDARSGGPPARSGRAREAIPTACVKDEVVAQAQGVLDDIQAALDAVPTLEANATAFLASTVVTVANGCNTAVTLADFYGTVLTSAAAAVSGDVLGRR